MEITGFTPMTALAGGNQLIEKTGKTVDGIDRVAGGVDQSVRQREIRAKNIDAGVDEIERCAFGHRSEFAYGSAV